ncbi:hypothetical protein AYL99_03081 [Fonsecaea erecta]|uniref:Uncharacterized protein n=1 Tax=Fonsecaea erecta TaxID=1367422 RepID=A0A178ZVN3_9EURO|nr:hypothetical protein AYL99_03081 [Fonsecaea erecta]OAP63854.1 hypothetical protein AYL99_03081 [Fonsecaea erecta]
MKTGFGCKDCGYIDEAKDKVRSHILREHGRQEEPTRASRAFALYSRARYQESDPSARDIPRAAFWTRGRNSAFQSAENSCPECGTLIAPYTKTGIIEHLRENHEIIVDLNCIGIRNRYAARQRAQPLTDTSHSVTDLEELEPHDTDEDDRMSCCDGDGEDYDEAQEETSEKLAVDGEYRERIAQGTETEMQESITTSKSTQNCIPECLRDIFMGWECGESA